MRIDLDNVYGPVTSRIVTVAPIPVHGAFGNVWTIPAGARLEVRTPDVDWCRYVSEPGKWPACVSPEELNAATAPEEE